MKKTRIVLSFPPSNVEEPVTYRLIKDYDLVVNILRASIDRESRAEWSWS